MACSVNLACSMNNFRIALANIRFPATADGQHDRLLGICHVVTDRPFWNIPAVHPNRLNVFIHKNSDYPESSTASVATVFVVGVVVVITAALIRTTSVPSTVRKPSVSPPKKYPSSTATTGFTKA